MNKYYYDIIIYQERKEFYNLMGYSNDEYVKIHDEFIKYNLKKFYNKLENNNKKRYNILFKCFNNKLISNVKLKKD